LVFFFLRGVLRIWGGGNRTEGLRTQLAIRVECIHASAEGNHLAF